MAGTWLRIYPGPFGCGIDHNKNTLSTRQGRLQTVVLAGDFIHRPAV